MEYVIILGFILIIILIVALMRSLAKNRTQNHAPPAPDVIVSTEKTRHLEQRPQLPERDTRRPSSATRLKYLRHIQRVYASSKATIRPAPEGATITRYAYRKRHYVMTQAERTFFAVLLSAIGSDHYVIPQAHLPIFLDYRTRGQNWKAAHAVINRRSVDFLVCNKHTLEPLVAIELDDSSHLKPDRRARDKLVESILSRARMPLVRFKWQPTYNPQEIATELADYLE